MRISGFSVLLVILVILLAACDIIPPASGGELGIYLLQDKDVTYHNDLGPIFLSLPHEETPLLSTEDIDFYDWSTHFVYLKTNKEAMKERLLDSNEMLMKYPLSPFIVTTGEQPRYVGFLQTLVSSMYMPSPSITDFGLKMDPDDILNITGTWNEDGEDTRDNKHVKQALIKSGLYHAGLGLEFDTNYGLNFHPLIGDTMEVEYRFTLTNYDEDALYVLDPNKASDSVFFYFNTRPSFHNVTSDERVRSNYYYYSNGHPDTSDYANLSWYTLLASGRSITRTVRSGKYTNVHAGEYEFFLSFSTPCFTMKKSKRNKLLGRIWLGQIHSPLNTFDYTP